MRSDWYHKYMPPRLVVFGAVAVVVVVLTIIFKFTNNDSSEPVSNSDEKLERHSSTPTQVENKVDNEPAWVNNEEGKLVRQIMSGTLNEQREAARAILNLVDVNIVEDEQLPEETESLYVIAPELTLLAMDGSQKGSLSRISLDELAMLMADMGFPFEEGKDPSTLLHSGIRKWVQAALDNPDQEGASAPLFLYAMALQQRPALDLTSEEWVSADYQLTHLELYVFISSFFQATQVDTANTDKKEGRTTGFLDIFIARAYAAEPVPACTYAKNWFNDLGKSNQTEHWTQFNGTLMQIIAGELTGLGIDKLSDANQAGAMVKKIMVPLSLIMKIQKLAMLYGAMEMDITAAPGDVHKPSLSEAGKEIKFTVTAGVNEQTYNEYLAQWNATPAAKQIKDCLSFLGLPWPTDMSDLAAEVENWDVSWTLLGGHATWGTEKNHFESAPQRRMSLTRKNKTHGEASFIVDVNKEKTEHEGDELTGYISAEASLRTDVAPLIGTYLNAAKAGEGAAKSSNGLTIFDVLGIGDLMIDTLSGWFQRIVDPERTFDVPVTYHKHRFPDYSYVGTVSATNTFTSGYEGPHDIDGDRGNATSTSTQNNHYRGRLETERMSSTPAAGRARWELAGGGTMSIAYQYSLDGSAQTWCIGGVTNKVWTASGSGAATDSVEAGGTIRREGSEENGYTFYLQFTGAGATLEYPLSTQGSATPDGCEFVSPYSYAETYTNYQEGFIDTMNFEFTSDEAYPEKISGSTTVEESNGTKTMWQWNFTRIDLSDNPTVTNAAGG